MLADFFGGYFNLKVTVAAGVKAVAAAEVAASAGLATPAAVGLRRPTTASLNAFWHLLSLHARGIFWRLFRPQAAASGVTVVGPPAQVLFSFVAPCAWPLPLLLPAAPGPCR